MKVGFVLSVKSFRLFAIACLVIFGWLCGTASAAYSSATVKNVRFSGNAEQTRIVIEMDRPLEYRWFTLASQGSRLVVDFPLVEWKLNQSENTSQGDGNGHGMVGKYRYAKNSPITSRLVLDLNEPVRIAKEFYLKPGPEQANHRLVLDLEKTDPISFIAGSGFEEPFLPSRTPQITVVSTPASTPSLRTASYSSPRLKPVNNRSSIKRLIVIDPGHGGKDPGAIGKRHKTLEKDVNLRAALALKKNLEQSGKYIVRLTRGKDVFIKLEDRVKVARRIEADLFISLHADSAGNAKARGASVYTLSERASNRSKTEILKGSNWLIDVDLAASRPEVNEILIDLSQRQTKNQSAVFAEILLPRLSKAGPLVRNSHRDGNLFVLLAPDVPAVLIEMGFLSNSHDEANLRSKRYITKLMVQVDHAIDDYFKKIDRLHASN